MAIMVFDVISFIAGVAAGALTAGLAGFLHGLERTADIQEKLRATTKKVDQLTNVLSNSGGNNSIGSDAKMKVDALQRDLDEIQDEIKRMYKRTTR